MADSENNEATTTPTPPLTPKPRKPRTNKAKKTVDPNAPKCVNPDCGKVAGTRGLCGSCYGAASGLVKAGTVTWADLEAKGKVLGRGGAAGTLKAKAKAWLMAE
jgi:hypothetical protein